MTEWLITIKPSFQTNLLALPAKEIRQVQQKLGLLMQDPLPDAKVKKQLKHWNGKLCRLRCGARGPLAGIDAKAGALDVLVIENLLSVLARGPIARGVVGDLQGLIEQAIGLHFPRAHVLVAECGLVLIDQPPEDS